MARTPVGARVKKSGVTGRRQLREHVILVGYKEKDRDVSFQVGLEVSVYTGRQVARILVKGEGAHQPRVGQI